MTTNEPVMVDIAHTLPSVSPAFFERLAVASARVLMTDYDGTLAPFRIERDQAVPYPGVSEVLGHLMETGHTRLVVVSGRAVDDLKSLLGLNPLPEIWGSHSWERYWPDGRYKIWSLAPDATQGLTEAKAWAEASGLRARCETKPACLALHWRDLSDRDIEILRLQARAQWAQLAQKWGLQLKEFDGGLELRVPGRDKGVAVRTVLTESPAGAVVAYLGDDLTDEDAFAALDAKGLSVLVRSQPRPTRAQAWLCPPEDLLGFLKMWMVA
jgi:trehalose-phosphatase